MTRYLCKKPDLDSPNATLQITRERALGIKQVMVASSHRRVGPFKRLVTPKRNQCVTAQIKLRQKRNQSNTGYAES